MSMKSKSSRITVFAILDVKSARHFIKHLIGQNLEPPNIMKIEAINSTAAAHGVPELAEP